LFTLIVYGYKYSLQSRRGVGLGGFRNLFKEERERVLGLTACEGKVSFYHRGEIV